MIQNQRKEDPVFQLLAAFATMETELALMTSLVVETSHTFKPGEREMLVRKLNNIRFKAGEMVGLVRIP